MSYGNGQNKQVWLSHFILCLRWSYNTCSDFYTISNILCHWRQLKKKIIIYKTLKTTIRTGSSLLKESLRAELYLIL